MLLAPDSILYSSIYVALMPIGFLFALILGGSIVVFVERARNDSRGWLGLRARPSTSRWAA